MKNLNLNYQELAFIMNLKPTFTKELFLNILKVEKVTTKAEIEAKELQKHFKLIKSVDPRYDGINELLFNLEHKSELYKEFLTKATFIKANKFLNAQGIFYKICSKKQLDHARELLNQRHIDYVDNINRRSEVKKKYVKPVE